jgi:hypothetical protein
LLPLAEANNSLVRSFCAALFVFSATASLLLGLGVSPAEAVARQDKGIVADLTWSINRDAMDREIALLQNADTAWVRLNLNWADLEPEEGRLDQDLLADVDYAVSQVRAAGMKVLAPIADGVPFWASADPNRFDNGGRYNKFWKPRDFGDYAKFARRMVARYAPRGVHAYELWNEPNYRHFWPSGPSPSDYTAMLRAAYPAIHDADPGATVVMGGLSGNDFRFLRGMYAAGARPYFDAAAVHPYTDSDPSTCWTDPNTGRPSEDAFCGIETVRSVMVAQGDASTQLWLTEFGWSTAPNAPHGVSESEQADRLRKAFNKIDDYPYVGPSFWYNLRNNYWQHNDPDDIEANYGLVRVDFSPKPAYAAYTNAA